MIDIVSICADNDDSARFELATRVHAAEGEELKNLRAAGVSVRRRSDGVRARRIGSAPALVALVMDDCDTKILIRADAFAQQWKSSK